MACFPKSGHFRSGQVRKFVHCSNPSVRDGGTSLFYSPSIRANAAKKVALLLGADPRLVVDRKMAPDEPNSSHQALEDLIVFLQPKPPSFIEQHAGSIVMVLLMLASLIAMIF